MKVVQFEHEGFVLALSPDVEHGEVRFVVDGTDDEGDEGTVTGYMSPEDARELSRYLLEMADRATEGAQPLAERPVWKDVKQPQPAGTPEAAATAAWDDMDVRR